MKGAGSFPRSFFIRFFQEHDTVIVLHMKTLQVFFVLMMFSGIGLVCGFSLGFPLSGCTAGFGAGALALGVHAITAGMPFTGILGAFAGFWLGIAFSYGALLPFQPVIDPGWFDIIRLIFSSVAGFALMLTGYRRASGVSFSSVIQRLRGGGTEPDMIVADSSSLIDGRIADITEAGFIGGILVLPNFVLREMQYIADSPDPVRRAKGRRGLDIVHRLKKISGVTVRISDEDFPKIGEVDLKLIALARSLNARIVTGDFNLGKIARLQGIGILNVNELANVLKPVLLPGEVISLFISKEGREPHQGIAYLDDGTMVVVDNARKHIGTLCEVIVSTVHQTSAGRMIFAKPKETGDVQG